MPKTCPKCQAIHGGYEVRCECGFDLSGVPATGSNAPPSPAPGGGRRRGAGEVVVRLGRLLSWVAAFVTLIWMGLRLMQLESERNFLLAMWPLAVGLAGAVWWAAIAVALGWVAELQRAHAVGSTRPPHQ